MEDNSLTRRIKEIMETRDVSFDKAIDIVLQEQAVRRDQEEQRYEAAKKGLLEKSGPKTMIIALDESMNKGQALLIAGKSIKMKSHHVIKEVSHGEIFSWLIASEYDIDQKQAQQILVSLESTEGKYTPEEIRAIVTEYVPFDIR